MIRTSLLSAALTVGVFTAASAATMDFSANMSGSQEVPPNQTAGSGDALVTLDTTKKQLSYTVTWFGLTGAATAAHFHGPASPGANAGVLIPIDGKGPASPQTGTATLTDAQMKDLESGMWYVNVHTAANPGGEIRGQLKQAGSAPATHGAPAKKP
jgi:hypothetical protein